MFNVRRLTGVEAFWVFVVFVGIFPPPLFIYFFQTFICRSFSCLFTHFHNFQPFLFSYYYPTRSPHSFIHSSFTFCLHKFFPYIGHMFPLQFSAIVSLLRTSHSGGLNGPGGGLGAKKLCSRPRSSRRSPVLRCSSVCDASCCSLYFSCPCWVKQGAIRKQSKTNF